MSGQDLPGCWVAVVVSDDRGHLLVAKRGDTQAWDLPVGLLHRWEDVLAGVRRVVAESPWACPSNGWPACTPRCGTG